VFEGVDAAGKTTQISMLESTLRSRGLPVVVTGVFRTLYGRDLREWFMNANRMAHANLRTQLFLLGSAMSQLIDEIDALTGSIVLVDRFVYTTLAYHGGGLEMGLDAVREVYMPVLSGLQPDLVLFMDIPPELIAMRKPATDRIESRDKEFHERVRNAYLTLASETVNSIVVDARKTELELHREVLERVIGLLGSTHKSIMRPGPGEMDVVL
jgi:dTMP kinase